MASRSRRPSTARRSRASASTMRALAGLIVVVGGAAVLAAAQAPPVATTLAQVSAPTVTGVRAEGLTAASALLDGFARDRKIAGGVAAVARHGQLAYLHASGVQDLASGTPMTERSLFRIYSMTKS